MKANEKKRIRKILSAALRRLQKGWTQGELARNKSGHPVEIDSPSACKFCATGALLTVDAYKNGTFNERMDVREAIEHALGEWNLVMWNDSLPRGPKGKAIVVSAFRRVIRALGK